VDVKTARNYSPARRDRTKSGFTLSEVMIAMVLISIMCLSVFGALQSTSRLALNTAIRSEAHRLMQAEAERLISVDFGSFGSSADQTITSSVKAIFGPNKDAQFALPANNANGRVSFTRRVIEVSSTSSSKTLRVEVQWTWQGHTSLISTPLFRSQ
jgi:prepilin-type N-terminal cleavage/methylation domain-containing protein